MKKRKLYLLTLVGICLILISAGFQPYDAVSGQSENPEPLCGDQAQWTVLAAAIDYRGTDYLYGLSDVIRLVRIDFTEPRVNVVALPRNLLVDPPATLNVQGKILLNQSYLFGSPGMDHFQDDGYGAGALAETIRDQFGIDSSHYVVVDFNALTVFIDAIGGIEIDLPEVVDDMPRGFFPAGKQTLNGEQTLRLARVRLKYSDIQRISNQTLILKAVLERLRQPFVTLKLVPALPGLLEAVLTDIKAEEMSDLFCLLPKIQPEDVVFHDPPLELLEYGAEYIPNMSQEMLIFRWGQDYLDWLHSALNAE